MSRTFLGVLPQVAIVAIVQILLGFGLNLRCRWRCHNQGLWSIPGTALDTAFGTALWAGRRPIALGTTLRSTLWPI
jgi:hypothetical protein